MAFRIQDVTLHLTPHDVSQPGGCSCGPASGNQPCAEASAQPPVGGGQSTLESGFGLGALQSQLRQVHADAM